jgi:amino acid transporter
MNVLIRIKNIVILLLSFFFLVFGIHLLAGSFRMQNPLEFVMTLFSASFIILFCIVGILYAFFRFFPGKADDETNHADTK